jgi:hypothetical protein
VGGAYLLVGGWRVAGRALIFKQTIFFEQTQKNWFCFSSLSYAPVLEKVSRSIYFSLSLPPFLVLVLDCPVLSVTYHNIITQYLCHYYLIDRKYDLLVRWKVG